MRGRSLQYHKIAQKCIKQACFTAVFFFSFHILFAQDCPPNIDFEKGNFNGWVCYTGNVINAGGINQINLTPSGPVGGRHDIISAFPGGGVDPYGGFPVNCPNGSGYSIKLGNTSGGAEAEGVSYTFTIPASRNEYNLIYHYAVVFQDPNHQQYEQPRMEIEITNVTDNKRIDCSSFAFFPYGTPLPGFKQSPNPGSATPVWYKEWSAVSINLDGNAGKTIKLFFKTADCTFRRHFGYAYIDVNSECSSKLEGASFCPDDTVVNVIAPYGYQSYQWYDLGFTQLLGSQQILSFTPPPANSMTVAVIVTPYNGYGCIDTLYADIRNDLVVTANAGRDTVSCNHNPVPIGMPPDLGVRYEWTPATGLSNASSSNPLAAPDVTTQYVLSARSKGGGCLQTDTVVVTASLVDNKIQLEGKPEFCIGSGDSAVLVVQVADSIQWYKDGVAIAGANGTRYRVTSTGLYHAVLFGGNGCSLTTVGQQINIASVPVALFSLSSSPDQCLFGNQFILKNNSSNSVGDMVYKWIMGDGTELSTRDVTYSYKKAGVYTIRLVVSSLSICADSAETTIIIHQNAVSSFAVEPTCINLPVTPVNNTVDTLGSPLHYLWTFGNGQTSTLRNPPSQVYPTAGNYKITLAVSSDRCPNPQHITTQTLLVDKPKAAIAYPVVYAVINLPLDLQARSFGGNVLWNPATFLDKPNSYNPVFKGTAEQLYTIDITSKTGCLTTDTQLVKLVKSIEIYVPSAFTPNNDGKNDILRPVMFGIKKLNYFRIYNRWGQMFYQTSDTGKGWDGYFRGAQQEMQTLVWVVEGVGVDGAVHSKKGTTVLIR
ncbi:MAG: PKD domain-containing protein [Ferruginibacter sp.]